MNKSTKQRKYNTCKTCEFMTSADKFTGITYNSLVEATRNAKHNQIVKMMPCGSKETYGIFNRNTNKVCGNNNSSKYGQIITEESHCQYHNNKAKEKYLNNKLKKTMKTECDGQLRFQ